MGFMTEVSILNDGLDRIEENPERLLDALRLACSERNVITAGAGYHVNCITVHPSHHADTPVLYLAHQNSFTSLDQFDIDREYGDRLHQEYVLRALEKDIETAERIIKNAKKYLTEKKAALA